MGEMTLDECRDFIARDEGWEFNTRVFGCWSSAEYGVKSQENHPVPETLDAAAAALPEGWSLVVTHDPEMFDGKWVAAAKYHSDRATTQAVDNCDTEILARFRLAVACRQSQGEAGGG